MLFSELADALELPTHRLALNVAHDVSIVRLAAGLKIFPLRWPRLGSEIAIEVRAHASSRSGDCNNRNPLSRSGKSRTAGNLFGYYMTENKLTHSSGCPLAISYVF